MVLDDLDRRILELLQSDGRLSYRAVAAQLGSTVPTVSARVRRMHDLGIIQGFTVVLDPSRFPAGDLGAIPAAVACHECGQSTQSPVETTLGGRRHAFCCPTCRAQFTQRYNRMRQASGPSG